MNKRLVSDRKLEHGWHVGMLLSRIPTDLRTRLPHIRSLQDVNDKINLFSVNHYLYCFMFIICVVIGNPVQAQLVAVVDGYDVGTYSQNNIPSFHPNQSRENKWQIRYFSGAYLKTITRSKTIFTRTIPNALNKAGETSKFLDVPGSGHSFPWIGFLDEGHLVLRKQQVRLSGNSDWPDITTKIFDGIAPDYSDAKKIWWIAAYDKIAPDSTKIVSYKFTGNLWVADTIDVFPGQVIGPNGIRFLANGGQRKSVAVVTDSLFRLDVWNGSIWQHFQKALVQKDRWLLNGVTRPDGTILWQYDKYLVSFKNGNLSVQSIPLDSTLLSFSSQRFFIENDDTWHFLFYVKEADRSFDMQYLRFKSGAWHVETIPFSAGREGALFVDADTVLVALFDPYKQKLTVIKRNPAGDWHKLFLDFAGDLGLDISADFNFDGGEPQAVIASYDRTNGDLKLANGYNDGYELRSPFNVQLVDTEGDVGRYPKVALFADRLHVVYFDKTLKQLKHARQMPFSFYPNQWGPWQIQSVDSSIVLTEPFGLLKKPDSNIEIAYCDSLSETIRYANLTDAGWELEEVVQSQVDVPGEVSLFRTDDSLYVGYVSQGRLFLSVRESPGIWHSRPIHTDFSVVYASACSDGTNIHFVYRARNGFQDNIQHVKNTTGNWTETRVVDTINNGTHLKVKSIGRFNIALMLAFTDDDRAQTYCYGSHQWFPVMQGSRFMSDTILDFTLSDYFTLTLYYRALGQIPVPYEQQPLPEIVSDVVSSIVDVVKQVQKQELQPEIAQYPNPFNIETTFEYSLSTNAKVKIDIYDILGRKVDTLVDAIKPPGQYRIAYSARSLPSGVYFYHYTIADKIGTHKMLLIK